MCNDDGFHTHGDGCIPISSTPNYELAYMACEVNCMPPIDHAQCAPDPIPIRTPYQSFAPGPPKSATPKSPTPRRCHPATSPLRSIRIAVLGVGFMGMGSGRSYVAAGAHTRAPRSPPEDGSGPAHPPVVSSESRAAMAPETPGIVAAMRQLREAGVVVLSSSSSMSSPPPSPLHLPIEGFAYARKCCASVASTSGRCGGRSLAARSAARSLARGVGGAAAHDRRAAAPAAADGGSATATAADGGSAEGRGAGAGGAGPQDELALYKRSFPDGSLLNIQG